MVATLATRTAAHEQLIEEYRRDRRETLADTFTFAVLILALGSSLQIPWLVVCLLLRRGWSDCFLPLLVATPFVALCLFSLIFWATLYSTGIALVRMKIILIRLTHRQPKRISDGRVEDTDRILTAHPWILELPPERYIACLRILKRILWVFDVVELFVPKRVASEECGDALEVITAGLRSARPPWRAYVKLVASLLWILLHAIHEVVKGPKSKG